MTWTTPADLRAQITKLWDRGKILTSLVNNEPLFPRRLSLICPTAPEMVSRFDDVRAWVLALQDIPYCRIKQRAFRHRELGANAVPDEVWIDSFDDAIAIIGKQREVTWFIALLEDIGRRQPEWLAWLARKPMQALALKENWSRFLDIAIWCRQHPRSGLYLRQIDLPGVHTKFVEAHRGTLGELLDLALPTDAIDLAVAGASRFDARYGFREKPARIRLRVLDSINAPAWPGEDIMITADAFTRLDPPVSRVFITENEINFLAFPPVERSLIIFGSGYGLELLETNWLSRCRIYYWGDIDTHGFAILDRLRSRFAYVTSFLMDHDTFAAFKHLSGTEPTPTKRELTKLTLAEQTLYDDLRDNRFGNNLRLEQEKIGFKWVQSNLTNI